MRQEWPGSIPWASRGDGFGSFDYLNPKCSVDGTKRLSNTLVFWYFLAVTAPWISGKYLVLFDSEGNVGLPDSPIGVCGGLPAIGSFRVVVQPHVGGDFVQHVDGGHLGFQGERGQ